MHNKMVKGYILAIISAVIFGLMPLMAKYIYSDGVNSLTLVFLRNFLALPSLAVLTFAKHRTFKISLKELPKISLISFFGCCITPVLLFSSYNYMATGIATVFHFVYPSLVVLIGIVFLKKKVPFSTTISVIMCFIGICMFYNPSAPFSLQGCAYALSSAVTFAIYVTMLSSYKLNTAKGLLLSFYIALISSIITFLLCIATNSLKLPSTLNGWVLCAIFAFMVTTLAVAFFQQGALIIGGEKTSILSTLEPITGIIVGFVAFNEPVTISIAIGSLLVVGASILTAISDIKKSSKKAKAE